jgi:hypothetical protein
MYLNATKLLAIPHSANDFDLLLAGKDRCVGGEVAAFLADAAAAIRKSKVNTAARDRVAIGLIYHETNAELALYGLKISSLVPVVKTKKTAKTQSTNSKSKSTIRRKAETP